MKRHILIPAFLIFLFRSTYQRLYYLFKAFELKAQNPSLILGKNLTLRNPSKIKFGKNVEIGDNVFLHAGGMKWCNYKGSITIGDNVKIGNNCIIWGTGANVSIGNNVGIGQGVQIYASTEFQGKFEGEVLSIPKSYQFKDVKIENDVIIYSQSIIGLGVSLYYGFR
jgi:acetyltransferase-like isoleucine patch superfamily enzyme